MINVRVSQTLNEIADLLEKMDENPFRVRSYRLAADNIANLTRDLRDYYLEGRLTSVPGVGRAMEIKIIEFIQTGELRYLHRLREAMYGTQRPLVLLPCREDNE